MSGKYGNVWLWFTLILDAVFIAMFIVLMKLKAISIRLSLIIIICMTMLFVTLTIVQAISIFNSNAIRSNRAKTTNKMFNARSKINEYMKGRPNGDAIDWDCTDGREELRRFNTPSGSEEFYGVSAKLLHNLKWVVVNYSVNTGEVVRLISDPGPEHLQDLFHKFSYIEGAGGGSQGFGRTEEDYSNNPYRGGQNIIVNPSENRRRKAASRVEAGSDKAYDVLSRSNYK